MKKTNNGKRGGLINGPSHDNGGVKAVVTETGKPIELEGDEVIINKKSSAKHWKQLSLINEDGGGIPIQDPKTIYKEGGNVSPAGFQVQSLIFEKKHFTAIQAKEWAIKNNYLARLSNIDATSDTFRIRQRSPIRFEKDSFKTIDFTDGVQAKVGIPKDAAEKAACGCNVSMEDGGNVDYKNLPLEELIKLKKKKYGKVDIESSVSSDEKELTDTIALKFSEINEKIAEKRRLTNKNINKMENEEIEVVISYTPVKDCLLTEGDDEIHYLFEGKEITNLESGHNEKWKITGLKKDTVILEHIVKSKLSHKKDDITISFAELRQLYNDGLVNIEGVDSLVKLNHCLKLINKCVDGKEEIKEYKEGGTVGENVQTYILNWKPYMPRYIIEYSDGYQTVSDYDRALIYAKKEGDATIIDVKTMETTNVYKGEEEKTMDTENVSEAEKIYIDIMEKWVIGTLKNAKGEIITDRDEAYKIAETSAKKIDKDFNSERCGGTFYEKGGVIPNNYEGKTAEEVWKEWSTVQRQHFLGDNKEEINKKDESLKVDMWYSNLYSELPEAVKDVLKEHIQMGQYGKGGNIPKIKITQLSDIPNLNEQVEKGAVTYRGLGLGKLFNDFYKVAKQSGVRITVDGKEYFITDTDFRKLEWDTESEKWKGKIRFSAPYRKMEKGGNITEPYVIVGVKDGYWIVITKPVSKEWAEEHFDLFTVPRGETKEIKKVSEVKAHKKVIGEEYLEGVVNKIDEATTGRDKEEALTILKSLLPTLKGKEKKGCLAKIKEFEKENSNEPKYKIGDMVYSYQNPEKKMPVSFIRKADTPYSHAYKLNLKTDDGYSRSSKWINEESLSFETE